MLVGVLPVNKPSELSSEGQNILNEVVHNLNMDTLKPSFGKVVNNQCLEVLRKVNKSLKLGITFLVGKLSTYPIGFRNFLELCKK